MRWFRHLLGWRPLSSGRLTDPPGAANPGGASSAGVAVRVGNTEAAQDRHLRRLHASRLFLVLVVVALRMEHAVDEQVGEMVVEALALRARLGAHHRD